MGFPFGLRARLAGPSPSFPRSLRAAGTSSKLTPRNLRSRIWSGAEREDFGNEVQGESRATSQHGSEQTLNSGTGAG